MKTKWLRAISIAKSSMPCESISNKNVSPSTSESQICMNLPLCLADWYTPHNIQIIDTCCIRPLKGGYFGDTSFPNNPGVAKKRSKNEVPLPKMELTNLISAKGWKMRWLFTPYSNGVTGWKMRTTTPRNLTNIPKMPLFWRDLPFSKLPSLGIYLKHPKVYSISGTCKIVIPRGCFSKTSFWGPMVHFPA